MAATIDIEVESGVFAEPVRHHRGYFAGDFDPLPPAELATSWSSPSDR